MRCYHFTPLTKRDLGFALEVDDLCLLHLMVQVIALTRPLANTGENRVTTMRFCDVVDELLNEHRLPHTGATEETDLASTSVGRKEIHYFDTSLKHLGLGGLIDEFGSGGMDGEVLHTLDRTTLIDRLTNNVHDSSASCQQ